MKRQSLVISVTLSLSVALAASEGCGGPNRELTGPTTPTRPSGPSYTISGTITAYRGGPLSAVRVGIECQAYWGIPCTAETDLQGHYSLSSPGAAPTGLWVGREGYQTAWKTSVSAQDAIANFVLHPSMMTLNPNGDVVAGTISGDEFMAGDDVLFGGLCARTACQVIEVAGFVGGPRLFELTLRWNNPARQLALLISRENDDSFHSAPADRYCCSSELSSIATVYLSGYYQVVAVAFEQAAGGPPGPADGQPFELTLRPMQ